MKINQSLALPLIRTSFRAIVEGIPAFRITCNQLSRSFKCNLQISISTIVNLSLRVPTFEPQSDQLSRWYNSVELHLINCRGNSNSQKPLLYIITCYMYMHVTSTMKKIPTPPNNHNHVLCIYYVYSL